MLIYILFVLGFILLIKGADLLVDGASSVAKKFKISSIVIGLTIVSFGTSMPELVVNIFSSLSGNTDLAIGNIIGSNISNILLILWVSAIIFPLTAKMNTVRKEIPLWLLAIIIIGIMANDIFLDGAAASRLWRADWLILLWFFIIFLFYTFGLAKNGWYQEDEKIKVFPTRKSVLYILWWLFGLTLGWNRIVNGAVHIATVLGRSQAVIGLTVVAIGTSLPELATSAMAAYKKQSDIAIGNVVWSNIFNTFWILWISSIISPLPFNAANNIDILVNIWASLLLFIAMIIGKKYILQKRQGVMFICLYITYIVYLVLIQ